MPRGGRGRALSAPSACAATTSPASISSSMNSPTGRSSPSCGRRNSTATRSRPISRSAASTGAAARSTAPSASTRTSSRASRSSPSSASRRVSRWRRTTCARACWTARRRSWSRWRPPGAHRMAAMRNLMRIYEQQHDWVRAIEVFRELDKSGKSPQENAIAHYFCELAEAAREARNLDEARAQLRAARAERRRFPRGALVRADIAIEQEDVALAERLLASVMTQDAALAIEVMPRLMRLARAAGAGRRCAGGAPGCGAARRRQRDCLRGDHDRCARFRAARAAGARIPGAGRNRRRAWCARSAAIPRRSTRAPCGKSRPCCAGSPPRRRATVARAAVFRASIISGNAPAARAGTASGR